MEYLGFVIRHDAKDPGSVVAGCIAKLTRMGRAVWRVYPPADQRLIPMLFVTSVTIKQKLAELSNVEDGAPASKILLRKPDPRFDFILNHLYDVRSKPKSYRSLPDDLRKAARFLFVLYGSKATVQLQAPQGGLRPQQIFFWTVGDFMKQTGEKLLATEPTDITLETDPPQSNPDIAMRVPILADTVRLHLAQPEPWYELYRQAVKAPEDLPTHKITLYGSEVCSIQEKEERSLHEENHVQLSQVITRHPKILLTGPSGSGKTTILKMLVADLLGSQPPIQNCLPIFVPMKHVGLRGKGLTALIVDAVVKQILTAKRSTIQQQIDIRRAHHGDMADAESLFALEVREFLTADAKRGDSRIALFLDGYDEIPETEDPDTEQETLMLAEKVDNIVISTHSSSVLHFLPEFKQFELEELSNEQIIPYITAHLDGKGEQFFDDEIASNGRILSMARTPGHLELIVQYHKTCPDRRLPTCLGPLLKFFIEKQYGEKRQVRRLRFPDVTESDIDFFLRKLGFKLVDDGRDKAETVLSYPDDLIRIFPSSTIAELSRLVKVAELIGFIEQSGRVSEEAETGGVVSFRHDNVRDYYAARTLLQGNRLSNIAGIEHILEYKKWHGALQMYFGVVESKARLEDDLALVGQFDPFLAACCAMWSPLAEETHAEQLMTSFTTDRVSTICLFDAASDTYGVPEAIARILSLKAPATLVEMYCNLATPDHLRNRVPDALVQKLGSGAFLYLREMVHTLPYPQNWHALNRIAALKTSQALDFFYNELINIVQRDDSCDIFHHYHLGIDTNQLSPAQIKALLARAQEVIKDPGLLGHIRCMVARAISNLGSRYTNELLQFQASDDPVVAEYATIALIKLHHAETIHKVLQDVQDGPAPPFLPGGNRLYELCENGEPYVDAELWHLFERSLDNPHVRPTPFLIPHCVARQTDFALLRRIVTKVLESNYEWPSMWQVFMESFPDIVADTADSLIPMIPANSTLWRQLVISLGCCGRKTYADDLLGILADTVACSAAPGLASDPTEVRTDNYFVELLLQAIRKLELARAIPILRQAISKQCEKAGGPIHRTLLFLLSLEPKTCRHVDEFFPFILKDNLSIMNWFSTINAVWNKWPPDVVEDFLLRLCQRIEAGLVGGRPRAVELMYRLLVYLREVSPRCFLTRMKNWPLVSLSQCH